MPLPSSKTELLQNLESAYLKLDAEFDSVDPVYSRVADLDGDVSCCDVLAYQIGWAELLMGWDQAECLGEIPDMPAPGYKWNQLGDLARSFYAPKAECSLAELRVEFQQSYQQLVTWIDALTEDELFSPGTRQWTGEKWPMVKWIQINTIAPYRSARTKVRRWKKQLTE